MIGGDYLSNGTIYFRLNKYLPDFSGKTTTGGSRSPLETLIHEVVCHKGTEAARDGTSIKEIVGVDPNNQKYKERLMDLLGRTILIRSGLLNKDEIVMQAQAQKIASALIDPIYYGDSNNQDEYNLWWEGNLKALVDKIDEKLKIAETREFPLSRE